MPTTRKSKASADWDMTDVEPAKLSGTKRKRDAEAESEEDEEEEEDHPPPAEVPPEPKKKLILTKEDCIKGGRTGGGRIGGSLANPHPPRPLIAQKRFEVASGTGTRTRYKPIEGELPPPIIIEGTRHAVKVLGLNYRHLGAHLAKNPKYPHVEGYVIEYATEAEKQQKKYRYR
jgi:hypothetical protein